MAKKKLPVPPEVKFRRRMRRYAKRLLLIIAAAAIYFYLLPLLFPAYAPQIENSKRTLIGAANQTKDKIDTILGAATELTGGLPTDKPPETIVKDTVDDLTDKIKALPGEQVKKVKREFCRDVIQEAILACEATASEESGNE